MPEYLNRAGNSGVERYEIDDDAILVRFRDGSSYLYTDESTGEGAVQTMKTLARVGFGLNRYINASVGKNYAYKLS